MKKLVEPEQKTVQDQLSCSEQTLQIEKQNLILVNSPYHSTESHFLNLSLIIGFSDPRFTKFFLIHSTTIDFINIEKIENTTFKTKSNFNSYLNLFLFVIKNSFNHTQKVTFATLSLILFTLSLITFSQASSTDATSENNQSQSRVKLEQNQLNQTQILNTYPNHKVEDLAAKNANLETEMKLKLKITGDLAPKSVVHSGTGLFFAQNMMYEHSINVYDRQFNLIKKITDKVNLATYDHSEFKDEQYKGSPVEVAFSPDGKTAYVTNYEMFGSEFTNPGYDTCEPSEQFDRSFIYRINTQTLAIENVIKVGSVPKFVAVSPNNRFVLVSNWCSGDLSIIDTQLNREVKRIFLGQFPRGIAIDPQSKKAYVAVMGTSDLAVVNLENYSVDWMSNIGLYPRHLVLDSAGKNLYVTLNGDDHVAQIDVGTGEILGKIFTGSAPRSMVLSEDDQYLYVVNYYSHTVSKVRTENLELIESITVDLNPIGITYDPQTRQIWVACYTGSLVILQDNKNQESKELSVKHE